MFGKTKAIVRGNGAHAASAGCGRLGGTPRPTLGGAQLVATEPAVAVNCDPPHTAAQERGPPVRSRNGRDARSPTQYFQRARCPLSQCGAETAGGDGTPPLPATAQKRGPPARSRNGRDARCPSATVAGRPPYLLTSGWKADFLMPRMAVGSSFVKAKHLEPRSFSDAPMR